MNYLKCLVPTILLFALLDFMWIGHLAKPLYLKYLSHHLNLSHGALSAKPFPALIVYLVFAVMIWNIVLPLSMGSIIQALKYGALAGFVVYGIYNMTNMSVLKSWPAEIAMIDWCWGISIGAITSSFCCFLHQKWC